VTQNRHAVKRSAQLATEWLLRDAPGYWMNETSGVLRPAVEAYLRDEPMSAEHIAAMRAYLRQWIAAPAWVGADVNILRSTVDGLTTRQALDDWIEAATSAGMDPL